jgi:hypothetical protein
MLWLSRSGAVSTSSASTIVGPVFLLRTI